jgi:glutamine amidotransferase
MVYIINYGLGNIGSIANMLKKSMVDFSIADEPGDIKNPTKLILPGVGSFDDGMTLLESGCWIDVLSRLVLLDKTPILGICLGMQLMTMESEEGRKKGLGWVDASVKRFKFFDSSIKIPHMGWNSVYAHNESCGIFSLLSNEDMRFYHVHSYYVFLNKLDDELATTNYYGQFTSAFRKENIYGVQFHPEKSHRYGMILLNNFVKL